MPRNRFLPAVLAPAAFVLLLTVACSEDDDRITGRFEIQVSEIFPDSCDGEENVFTSELDIRLDGQVFTVTFADTAVLTGMLDNQGLIQADGEVSVPVTVDGQVQLVESNMRMQIRVRRGGRLEATGVIEYDGTHPSSPGVACTQPFQAVGQRP